MFRLGPFFLLPLLLLAPIHTTHASERGFIGSFLCTLGSYIGIECDTEVSITLLEDSDPPLPTPAPITNTIYQPGTTTVIERYNTTTTVPVYRDSTPELTQADLDRAIYLLRQEFIFTNNTKPKSLEIIKQTDRRVSSTLFEKQIDSLADDSSDSDRDLRDELTAIDQTNYDQLLTIISNATGTLSSNSFNQGGNSFAGPGVLGTLTNQPLSLVTNGTERLFVGVDGNVGIGTTTPSAKLSITGTAGTGDIFAIASSTNSRLFTVTSGGNVGIGTSNTQERLRVFGSNTGITIEDTDWAHFKLIADSDGNDWRTAIVQSGTNGDLQFRLGQGAAGIDGSADSKLYITNGGNVGIGTITPSAKLSITGTAGTGDIFAIASSTNSRLFTVTSGGNVGIGTTTPSAKLSITGTAGTGDIFAIASSTNSRLFTVTGGGNVGIGTAAPGQLLSVAGTASVQGTLFTNDITSFTGGQLTIQNGDTGIRFLMSSANAFVTWNNSFDVSMMYINANGNVGIGTTTPTARLHLAAGTASASTAPLKLTSGTLMTTPEAGAIEYLTNQFYLRGSDGLSVAGNVGIGTTAPNNALSVVRNENSSAALIGITNNDSGTAARASIEFTNDAGGGAFIGLNGSATGPGIGHPDTLLAQTSKANGIAFIASHDDGIWRVLTGGTASVNERLRITATGNVGIGTTAPVTSLQVARSNPSLATTGVYQQLELTGGTGAEANRLSLGVLTTAVGGAPIGTGVIQALVNASAFTNLLLNPNGGNVAIGQTTATAKLHLAAGTASASTAPLKLTSGTLMTTPEAGAIEYLTNRFHIRGSDGLSVAGNVGIGTTNPTDILTIDAGGAGSSRNTIRLGTGGWSEPGSVASGTVDGTKLNLHNSGDNSNQIGMNASGALWFRTGGSQASNFLWFTANDNVSVPTERMRLSNNGNVGIGTIAPLGKLDIVGSNNPGVGGEPTHLGTFRLIDSGGFAGLAGGLEFKSTSGGGGYGFRISSPDLGNGETPLYFQRRANSATWTDSMTILGSNGNVGIGITSPTAKLSVTGSGTGTGLAFNVADSANTPRFTVLDNGSVGIGTTTPSAKLFITGTAGTGDIFAIASSTNARLFTVTSGGNVGIGTTTIPERLTVDGTIRASNLLSGGPTTLSTDVNGNIITTPSDVKLKRNITNIENALETVLNLRGVRYEWKDTTRFGNKVEVGFLAQEVDLLIPEVVRKGGEYWALNTPNMLAVVVEAIKELWTYIEAKFAEQETANTEQDTAITELKQEIETLKSEVRELKEGPAPTPTPTPTPEPEVVAEEEEEVVPEPVEEVIEESEPEVEEAVVEEEV